LHSDVYRCEATAGVRTPDLAVWVSGYADDQGGGGDDTGLSAECVQDCQYDRDGGGVYRGSGGSDSGAVWSEGADDSGLRGRGASGRRWKGEDVPLRGAGQSAVDASSDAGFGVPDVAGHQYGDGGDELPTDGRDGLGGAACSADAWGDDGERPESRGSQCGFVCGRPVWQGVWERSGTASGDGVALVAGGGG